MLDRGDLARDDRHVADGVEPDRRIDQTPAFDDEIIRRCRHITNVGERRGRCAEELAPIHHGPPFPNIDDGCNFYHKVRAERAEPCGRCKQQLLLSVAGQLTQNLSNHRNG